MTTRTRLRVEKHVAIFRAQHALLGTATVRSVAKESGSSKSTVHLDLTVRLPAISDEDFAFILPILEGNLAERHIRGGAATARRYEQRSVR